MLRLSDLAYLGRQREEYPISGLLDESLYGQPPAPSNYPMLLAQAPTSGGIAGGVHHEINTNPELYGPRPTAPTVAPGPGNYSSPPNPRATVQTPDGRYVTPEEFEMLQRRLRERSQRMTK